MRRDDFKAFSQLLTDVHAFYGKDVSEFALDVWWQAMKPYDLPAIQQALGRHTMNPDKGQWLPKPADVVAMLAGRTVDSAQMAWSKVDQAVRQVGTWQSVVFDDPVIHRVLQDMGGWLLLGNKSVDEWPFVAKEFETRYRGFAMRSETPEFPPVLIGRFEVQNGQSGHRSEPPVLIGDRAKAEQVLLTGNGGGLRVHALSDTAMKALEARRAKAVPAIERTAA